MKNKKGFKKFIWIFAFIVVLAIIFGVFVFDIPGAIKTKGYQKELKEFLTETKVMEEADDDKSLYLGGRNFKIDGTPVYVFELRYNENAEENVGGYLGSFAISKDKQSFYYHIPAEKSETGLPKWKKLN